MWSQLLYIFLLLICPLGQIKGHLIADNQSLETVVYDVADPNKTDEDVFNDNRNMSRRMYHDY